MLAQTDQIVTGYAVPAAAIVKDRNNQDIVWVHVGAERFVPRTVASCQLTASPSTVVDGWRTGTASRRRARRLLNQVR